MFDLLVMTCVHPSDDLCCIFCNHVVAYVAASAEELTNSFVKEESVLGKLQKELVDLNAMMIERKNQRQHQQGKMKFSELGEPSVGHSQTPNSNHPKGCIEFGNSGERGHVEEVHFPKKEAQESEQSNMYVRQRDGPRMRVKSMAIRTPFATFSGRKRHK
ncbi:hypothetical protein DEO72_LG10g3573 [Vigna unguiculata]|uniref:Uncharacterized protein n=1 Tax=Vigna unguiculata TaxID=3917 RepID=A0A4D6NH91_VIGUN|nr:hypothetical protein DEO72_LG10g3573 [Vigna unguiculata]